MATPEPIYPLDPGLAAPARPRLVVRPTPRELEILQLVADGCSTTMIATALFISPETVKSHVGNAMTRLGASSRAHAVALLYRRGLLA
jgi:DNA-binding CsgD family transcriptional regulator